MSKRAAILCDDPKVALGRSFADDAASHAGGELDETGRNSWRALLLGAPPIAAHT